MHVRSFALMGLSVLTLTSASPSGVNHRGLHKRDAQICDALPAKWNYQGCFTDDPSSRVLTGPDFCDDGMDEVKCIEFCDARGYGTAGVEYGRECYCGYQLQSSSQQTPDTDCNMACKGNDRQLCGAGNRLNVFTNGNAPPSINPGSDGYQSIGCYVDNAGARILSTRANTPSNLKVSDCTAACKAGGFQYAGVEFGSECFCGNTIDNGGVPATDGRCNFACTADPTSYCGGRAGINLYQIPPASACNNPGNTNIGFSTSQCGSSNACYCVSTPEGSNACVNDGACSQHCSTSKDCGSGSVCVLNDYCGFSNCLPLGTCPNTSSPHRMFKRRTLSVRDGSSLHPTGGDVSKRDGSSLHGNVGGDDK